MKNARTNKDHTNLGPVSAYPVAEHRYLWSYPIANPLPITWREVRDAAPYKVGDVVYIIYGDGFTKAIIIGVDAVKDSYDDWRETYKVCRETKAGQWSKLWHMVHPGFIQRGYQRAGLAPDIPDKFLY